jgi:tRNA G10  N-methylase Trm11
VVIEALSMGVNAKGYEINRPIAINAQQNLSFFNYPDVITEGDMHTIKDHFDVAIIDIPYGLYQVVTLEEQQEIINTARRIADRLILVTYDNMEKMIDVAGFELIEKVRVAKGKLVRWVNVCE